MFHLKSNDFLPNYKMTLTYFCSLAKSCSGTSSPHVSRFSQELDWFMSLSFDYFSIKERWYQL